MFTTDRAARTRDAFVASRFVPTFRGKRLRPFEMALLKIASRKRAQTVEGKQISDRSQFAILRGRIAGRTTPQSFRQELDALRIRYGRLDFSAYGDRLQKFRPHHSAESPAARMTTVGAQIGKANEIFTGDPDSSDTTERRECQRRLSRRTPPIL